MKKQNRQKTIEALRNKNVDLPCPRCSGDDFEMAGNTVVRLSENNSTIIGNSGIPCAIIACTQCGFMTFHALYPLGLFSNIKETNE